MNLNGITQNPTALLNANPALKPQSERTAQGAFPGAFSGELPFASMVQDILQSVDAQQQTVATDVEKIANGEADNLQAIAANVAKADLSFRFLMEVRDKLISSYQEVMRMQV